MRWRHTRVWQVPWRPLFLELERWPTYPSRAWTQRAWLRQVRQAQVWHREWLEAMYEWSEPLDRELVAEVEADEDEEEREQRTPQRTASLSSQGIAAQQIPGALRYSPSSMRWKDIRRSSLTMEGPASRT